MLNRKIQPPFSENTTPLFGKYNPPFRKIQPPFTLSNSYLFSEAITPFFGKYYPYFAHLLPNFRSGFPSIL